MKIEVSDPCLSRLRVTWNPLADVLASAVLLARHAPNVQFPYRTWMQDARRATASGSGTALLAWARHWPAGKIPWFLLPPVRGGVPRELDDLVSGWRTHPPELVRDRLTTAYPTGVPAVFEGFVSSPVAAFESLIGMVHDYVTVVARPYWPIVCDVVEEELVRCGHAIATTGLDGFLADLHTRVRWSRPTLTLNTGTPEHGTPVPEAITFNPLVFLRDQVFVHSLDPPAVSVSYQARGAAQLALTPLPEMKDDGLTLLLGRSRASLLALLNAPSTTTTLAGQLRLAASTVSEHLTALRAADIVERQRRGNRVFYGLTARGRELLRVLATTDT